MVQKFYGLGVSQGGWYILNKYRIFKIQISWPLFRASLDHWDDRYTKPDAFYQQQFLDQARWKEFNTINIRNFVFKTSPAIHMFTCKIQSMDCVKMWKWKRRRVKNKQNSLKIVLGSLSPVVCFLYLNSQQVCMGHAWSLTRQPKKRMRQLAVYSSKRNHSYHVITLIRLQSGIKILEKDSEIFSWTEYHRCHIWLGWISKHVLGLL